MQRACGCEPVAHKGLIELAAIVQGFNHAVPLVELANVPTRAEAHHQPVADAHLAKRLRHAREIRKNKRVAVRAGAAAHLLQPTGSKVAERHTGGGGGVEEGELHRAHVRE